MASDSPGIKVTASDALEFEAVEPKVRKSSSALKTIVFVIVAVVMGAMSWAYMATASCHCLATLKTRYPSFGLILVQLRYAQKTPAGCKFQTATNWFIIEFKTVAQKQRVKQLSNDCFLHQKSSYQGQKRRQ